MIVGTLPFNGKNYQESINAIMNEPYVIPEEIEKGLSFEVIIIIIRLKIYFPDFLQKITQTYLMVANCDNSTVLKDGSWLSICIPRAVLVVVLGPNNFT